MRDIARMKIVRSEYLDRKRAAGLCWQCTAPAAEGKARCRPCLDRHTALAMQYKRARNAKGKCQQCSLRPIGRTRTRCDVCAEKQNVMRRKWRKSS